MRLLALCPRIRKEAGRIVATTAWRVRLLSLGTMFRRVVVDPDRATIVVRSRWLWLFRFERTVPFSEVRAVTYGYDDLSPGSVLAYAHDGLDRFSVGLRLADDSEVHLFHFVGDGTFANDGPLPDWLYWDEYAFDFSGSQENESRVFVDLLSKMTGATVAPPR